MTHIDTVPEVMGKIHCQWIEQFILQEITSSRQSVFHLYQL